MKLCLHKFDANEPNTMSANALFLAQIVRKKIKKHNVIPKRMLNNESVEFKSIKV